MTFDFEKALTYISKDSQWGNKLLAGGGLVLSTFAVFVFPLLSTLFGSFLVFLLTFIPAVIFYILIWLAISGYVCETANRRINNPEDYILPDWSNFGALMFLGVKYTLGYLLYLLPVIIFGLIFLAVCIFGLSGIKEHISSLNVFGFMFLVAFGALLMFLYILTMVFLPLMMTNFFKYKKILSFVNLKEAFLMVKDNAMNYFFLILLFIAVTMLCQIVCSFLMATLVGVIFIPVLYIYIYYVIAEICAQFALSKEKQTSEN